MYIYIYFFFLSYCRKILFKWLSYPKICHDDSNRNCQGLFSVPYLCTCVHSPHTHIYIHTHKYIHTHAHIHTHIDRHTHTHTLQEMHLWGLGPLSITDSCFSSKHWQAWAEKDTGPVWSTVIRETGRQAGEKKQKYWSQELTGFYWRIQW